MISSNKQLKKLRVEKSNLIAKEQDQSKKQQKEKNIESPSKQLGSFGKAIGGIAKNILKGPLSFFDKIKEFFGLILMGIIINNLPYMIDQIKGFFDRNRWIIDGTKFILKSISSGIMGIINLVKMFSPSKQESLTKDAQQLKKEFSRLDGELIDDNVEINRRLTELEKEQAKNNQKPSSPPQSSTSIPNVNGEKSQPSTNQKPPELPKFAKGGKVDTKTQPQARKTTVSGSSLGTTKQSVRSKKAVQTVNYFSFLNTNNEVAQEIAGKDAKNKDTFKEILTSLKTIQEIRKVVGDDEIPGQSPGPPGPPPGDDGIPINVDPDEVIGTVGHTGRVRPAGPDGTHIHIENHSSRGGSIPRSVKNNIFVSGVPMPQRLRFTSGIMEPNRPNHMGEDYAGEPNQPITLGGGLKFVQYIPDDGGGYGNRVIIQAPDGTKYSLNHLNSGPRNLQKLRELQDNQRIRQFGTPSGQASWYGPGFQGNKTASGEIFDTNQLTAAHRTLPFGTKVKVTNSANGKSIIVRINDRGPFAVNRNGKAIKPLRPHPSRIIDLSKAAMDALGGSGVIDVKLEVLPSSQQRASLTPSQRKRIIGEDVDSSSIALVNQPYIVDKVIPVPFLTPSLVG